MLLPHARVMMANHDRTMTRQFNPNAASAAQAMPTGEPEPRQDKDGSW
jgi:hypothetical protein